MFSLLARCNEDVRAQLFTVPALIVTAVHSLMFIGMLSLAVMIGWHAFGGDIEVTYLPLPAPLPDVTPVKHTRR